MKVNIPIDTIYSAILEDVEYRHNNGSLKNQDNELKFTEKCEKHVNILMHYNVDNYPVFEKEGIEVTDMHGAELQFNLTNKNYDPNQKPFDLLDKIERLIYNLETRDALENYMPFGKRKRDIVF